MPAHATDFQREFLKSLYRGLRGDEPSVCAAYVKAEAEGRVFRRAGDLCLPPEVYAKSLLEDGKVRGWLSGPDGLG